MITRVSLILPFCLFITEAYPQAMPQGNSASRYTFRWNNGRGYQPFRHATEKSLHIDNITSLPEEDLIHLPSPLSSFTLTFRAHNAHAQPGRRHFYLDAAGERKSESSPSWGILMVFNSTDTIRAEIKTIERHLPLSSYGATEVSIRKDKTAPPIIFVTEEKSPLLPYNASNIWSFSLSDGILNIWGGAHSISHLFSTSLPAASCTAIGFYSNPASDLTVTDIMLKDDSPLSSLTPSPWKGEKEFEALLKKSKDPLEGYWTIFDRDLEESLLRLGGNYRLAIMKNGENYSVIYLSGATIHNKKWEQGMLKAILTPGDFQNVFKVEWFDAEGNPLSNSIIVQREDDVLTIQFPYQNSSIRLRKIAR